MLSDCLLYRQPSGRAAHEWFSPAAVICALAASQASRVVLVKHGLDPVGIPSATLGMQELLPLPGVQGLGLQDSQRSAVLPSIGCALDWLRRCVRERPNLRVQVILLCRRRRPFGGHC